MTPNRFVLSLQWNKDEGSVLILSDGASETRIRLGDLLFPDFYALDLLHAVRLLLLGAYESSFKWLVVTESSSVKNYQYLWRLLLREDGLVQIHLLKLEGLNTLVEEKGKTLLSRECDLLTFAKRLYHQVGQQYYHSTRKDAITLQGYQEFKDALIAFEHQHGKHTE